jgi:hypothetical protein
VLERSVPGFRAVFLGFTQIFAAVWPNLLQLALVVARFRQRMLNLSERFKRALQVLVRLDDDGDGSLKIHSRMIPQQH